MNKISTFSSIIIGHINIGNKTYEAEISSNVLVVKTEFLSKDLIGEITRHIIAFNSEAKGSPVYYLYIDKRVTSYYSCTSFHILLLYRHFKDTKEVRFEIISKGFSNSINTPRQKLKSPLSTIRTNVGKDFLQSNAIICENEYKVSFSNVAWPSNNNLCPVEFCSSMNLKPLDNSFVDKLYDIFIFANAYLQFVTLNTYPIIDSLIIRNDVGGYSEIEIFYDYSEYDDKNDRYLYTKCLGENINKIIECFPNAMTRQHNLYHYKRGWVFEFDIVRLSGTFEGVFRENVEKNEFYLKQLQKRKEEIHYDELSNELKQFAKQHNIRGNEDYLGCTQMFRIYGGTLKNKLEFVLTEFCKTMKMIVIDTGFFYSASKFESRIKDSRNSICHGLNDKPIDWNNIGNDTLLLQELIYFMLLKYKLELSDQMIRKILNESFGSLNKDLSLYRKNDPRINWID